MSRPGDWMCPNCREMVFASKSNCRKCGASKNSQQSNPQGRGGDWNCPKCNDIVFASKSQCRKCGTSRSNVQPISAGASFLSGAERKPGDWTCPNCSDLVFASKSNCRRCNTAKPSTLPPSASVAPPIEQKAASQFECPVCLDAFTSSGAAIPKVLPCGHTVCAPCCALSSMCPLDRREFENLNVEQLPTNFLAIAANEVTASSSSLPPSSSSSSPPSSLSASDVSAQSTFAGDWKCRCGDIVFASRSACRKCGARRSAGPS